MPVYRLEDITGLGFKGKQNLGMAAETRSFPQNTSNNAAQYDGKHRQ